MKRVAFLTTARSDFGTMLAVLTGISRRAEVDLLIGGAHFSPNQGGTYREIVETLEHLPVQKIPVDFLLEIDLPSAQAKSVGVAQISISQVFSAAAYDALVLLGDRWELFAASIPALLYRIPIAHISGGEVTRGVMDDLVRHATSKLSHLHFVAANAYAKNLSRMGEEDWRITVAGECGLDAIHKGDFATGAEIQEKFGVNVARGGLLVTLHPSTLDLDFPVETQVGGLVDALARFQGTQIIITAPGAEQGSQIMRASLERFAENQAEAWFIPSLGRRNYLGLMKACHAVVGNSSSGVLEAASLGVPAVNIGNRQKDRLSSESVIHTDYGADAIETGIRKALAPAFKAFAATAANPCDPYRDGRNSERIVHGLLTALATVPREKLLAKRFEPGVVRSRWNTLLKGF